MNISALFPNTVLLLILFAIVSLLVKFVFTKKHHTNIKKRELAPIDETNLYYAGWISNLATRKITFTVVAETTGYIGFGLSPEGGKTD